MKTYKTHFSEKESDITIISESKKAILAAKESFYRHRGNLEKYVNKNTQFLTSLSPIKQDSDIEVIKIMSEVAYICDVGPMAAVAGAIAEYVGKDLSPLSAEVIVENGGDIYAMIRKIRRIGIYAGDSPFTGKIALEIKPEETPVGICTSSGTVGHSLSLGSADAVLVLSADTALADAVATAVGNTVKTIRDINAGLEQVKTIEGLAGTVIIKGDKIGVWGDIKLVSL